MVPGTARRIPGRIAPAVRDMIIYSGHGRLTGGNAG
jgi:hypothetical protein